jgi:hypothetical protein
MLDRLEAVVWVFVLWVSFKYKWVDRRMPARAGGTLLRGVWVLVLR